MDKSMDKQKHSPRDMPHKGSQQAKSGQAMPPGQMAPPPKGTSHTGNK